MLQARGQPWSSLCFCLCLLGAAKRPLWPCRDPRDTQRMHRECAAGSRQGGGGTAPTWAGGSSVIPADAASPPCASRQAEPGTCSPSPALRPHLSGLLEELAPPSVSIATPAAAARAHKTIPAGSAAPPRQRRYRGCERERGRCEQRSPGGVSTAPRCQRTSPRLPGQQLRQTGARGAREAAPRGGTRHAAGAGKGIAQGSLGQLHPGNTKSWGETEEERLQTPNLPRPGRLCFPQPKAELKTRAGAGDRPQGTRSWQMLTQSIW